MNGALSEMLEMKRKMFAVFLAIIIVTQVVALPLVKEDTKSIYRLSGNISPTEYDIEIEPKLNGNDFDSFEGTVTIKALVKSGTENIDIHAGKDINFEEFKVGDKEKNPVKDVNYDGDKDHEGNEVYNIDLEEDNSKEDNSKEDKEIEIYIKYNSTFPPGMYGFYKSYYTENNDKKVLLTTQFEPTHARKAFPCFDEPKYKAIFKLSLKVPKGFAAISNSVGNSESDAEDEKKTYRFGATPLMSTYLLAFIVYDGETYIKNEDIQNKFSTWGRKSEIEDNNASNLSQTYGYQILEVMGEHTGIKYTLDDIEKIENKPTKTDQAAIPDFSAGAMENWGLVTYRETALLFKEGKHSEAAKKRVIEVIAHELAHQWYGNLVTTEWWNSIWLNEGFATYYEYFLTHKVVGPEEDWRMEERFLVDEQMRALAVDATITSSPLTNNLVDSPSSVSSHFGTITYSKGGSIVRMFEDIIGSTFADRLTSYLKENAGEAVKPDALFDALAKDPPEEIGLSETDLKGIFTRWTEQNGFPLVHIKKNENNQIVAEQSQFLLEGEGENKYDIKLTLISNQDELQTTQWLKHDENDKALGELEANKWVLVKTTGYFRVKYHDDILRALIHQMHNNEENTENKIEPIERGVLVDNALNLARAKKMEYDLAIEVLNYLEHEIDYIPWYAASTGLSFLHRMLVNSEKDESNTINKYILSIIDHVYSEVIKNEPETHIDKVHYANIFNWACRAGHEDCLEKVKDDFQNYIDGEGKNIDIINTVYCYSVKNNETAWLILWDKLMEEQDATIRSVLISALGCTTNKLALHMYLENALSGQYIRAQDAASVFSSVYSNPDGVEVCLEFLERRLTAVADTTETVMNAMPNIVNGIASYLTTEAERDRLRALADTDGLDSDLKNVIEAAVKTVETNIEWRTNFEEPVLEALTKQISTPGGAWVTKPLMFLTIIISIAVSLM